MSSYQKFPIVTEDTLLNNSNTRPSDGLRTPPLSNEEISMESSVSIAKILNDPATVCTDCKKLFYQNEQNKGSMAYYRCDKCQKMFCIKTCINSCVIL